MSLMWSGDVGQFEQGESDGKDNSKRVGDEI